MSAVDVGAGFARTPSTSTTTSNPLPCAPNDPPLDQQFSPTAKAKIDFALPGDKADLSETIIVYSDVATVQQALAAGEKGLACKTATITAGTSKVPVQISGPADLTSAIKVKVDKCEGWSVSAQGVNVSIIVGQVGQQLVSLTFSAPTSTDASKLPSASAITEKALAKVKAGR